LDASKVGIGTAVEGKRNRKLWGKISVNLGRNRWGLIRPGEDRYMPGTPYSTVRKDNEGVTWQQVHIPNSDRYLPIGTEVEGIQNREVWGKIWVDLGPNHYGLIRPGEDRYMPGTPYSTVRKDNEGVNWQVHIPNSD
jgi:hypothetical protein